MLSTDTVSLNPNPLVQALGKPAKEFTKADIIGYIEDNDIQMLNLRYVGGDGRLKTLNFAIQSKAHLDRVLTLGERVDGSSLFAFVALAILEPSNRSASMRAVVTSPSMIAGSS